MSERIRLKKPPIVTLVTLADGITMLREDCSEYLKRCNLQFDATITDPPYGNFTHEGARTKSVRLYRDDQGIDSFEALSNLDFVRLILDTTEGWCLFFCELEWLGKYQAVDSDRYIRGAIWDRMMNTPQVSGDRPGQGAEGIAVMHGRGKTLSWNGGGLPGKFRHGQEREGKLHPTQKPLSLMVELIQLFTNPGDLVFDPFAGSGTTGVACIMTGRKFFGIEKDPTYFKIACDRLDKELRAPNMLIDKPKRMKAMF